MLNMKSILRASTVVSVLLVAPFTFAAEDDIAALKARISALESTSAWNSAAMQQSENPLKINGFISAGVATANTDAGGQVSQRITDDLRYQKNQNFGLQVSYQLGERTDVVGQMLGRGDEGDFEVKMNWAYIGHVLFQNKGVMEQMKIRVGREPAAIYMISDYYDVGYAYPWITPPVESYDAIGGGVLNGVDILTDFSLPNDWTLQTQTFIGQSDVPSDARYVVNDFDKIFGINFNFVKDAWRIRAGYAQAIVQYDACCGLTNGFDTLVGGYNDVDAGIVALEASIDALSLPTYSPTGYSADAITDTSDNLPGNFSGIGFTYDDGNWLVMSEYILQKWDTFNPDEVSAYVTVGKRFGDFTPFLSYSYQDIEDEGDAEDLLDKLAEMQAALDNVTGDASVQGTLAQLPGAQFAVAALEADLAAAYANVANPAAPTGPELALIDGTATALAGAQAQLDQLNLLQSSIDDLGAGIAQISGGVGSLSVIPQKTYSVGVRYDFAPGATAKLQFDKITDFEDTRGSLDSVYVSHFAIQAVF